MSEKCKPKYKNLNLIQSFSEQRYATVQLMEQACQNDEWLRQKVENLSYLSPPAVRKRFSPILVDDNQSYGYNISGKKKDENNTKDIASNEIIFDFEQTKQVKIDFTDFNLIDENKSDCRFVSLIDNGAEVHEAVIPSVESSALNTSVKNFTEGAKINSYWYVGYDKAKSYQVRPDWIWNEFDSEIPSIARAQTFKVPAGTQGLLESVSLYIQNNGVTNSNWGSPLYVQIWNTEEKTVQKTKWDKQKKKSVKDTGTEKIHWPKGSTKKPLAQSVFYPDETNPGFYNFVLDKSVLIGDISKDTYYAIVVLSPLSHYEHCPRIGGWGRNCAVDKYSGGDAFLSENNGKTWIRYGRNDTKVAYKEGKYTPQDFAFQCHIRTSSTGYVADEEFYLYLKPIFVNPMTSVSLGGSFIGHVTNGDGISLMFECSTDGRTWVPLSTDSTLNYFTTSHPIVLFVRARMKTTNTSRTPLIREITLTFNTELPKSMYVRTKFYTPKLSPMLGASLWGRIYAPFELKPNDGKIDCKVEIIQDKIVKEHFHIISINELADFEYLELFDADDLGTTETSIVSYLTDHPSVIHSLKKENIYIKPVTVDETEYLLSFDKNDGTSDIGGISLANSPAYPIQQCLIQPDGTEKVVSYGEWYDFIVDYEDNVLTIDSTVLEDMPVGALSVSYNPIFIDGLSLEEVGTRIDPDTGLSEEGLILDYFKEEFVIDSNNVESRRVKLRVSPVDPIKQVIINKDTDFEEELYENIDFDVDYTSKELIFRQLDTDGVSSRLKENDTLEVIYTPNIEDTSIAIGYYVTREDSNHECYLKPNYFEYKV